MIRDTEQQMASRGYGDSVDTNHVIEHRISIGPCLRNALIDAFLLVAVEWLRVFLSDVSPKDARRLH